MTADPGSACVMYIRVYTTHVAGAPLSDRSLPGIDWTQPCEPYSIKSSREYGLVSVSLFSLYISFYLSLFSGIAPVKPGLFRALRAHHVDVIANSSRARDRRRYHLRVIPLTKLNLGDVASSGNPIYALCDACVAATTLFTSALSIVYLTIYFWLQK